MSAAKSKTTGLTVKQEAFALAYFETANAAQAYRMAYDVEPNSRDSWLYVEASQLLDNPKVAQRLIELQEQAKTLSFYTRQKALDEYDEARTMASEVKNPSAMVSAINGKVKLMGLDAPQRIDHTTGGERLPAAPQPVDAALLSALVDKLTG